jgi:hypothetical protein
MIRYQFLDDRMHEIILRFSNGFDIDHVYETYNRGNYSFSQLIFMMKRVFTQNNLHRHFKRNREITLIIQEDGKFIYNKVIYYNKSSIQEPLQCTISIKVHSLKYLNKQKRP